MKQILAILMIAAFVYLAKTLYNEYATIKNRDFATEKTSQPAQPTGAALSGMPESLESSFQAAQKQGPAAVKNWLRNYRPYVHDPRLAEIELDYVVLVSRQDPVEAKQVFQSVKDRTPSSSPLYDRVKKLEKTFQ
jgi:hypothetical protein